MTEKFVLWNEDKKGYLKKGCSLINIQDGRIRTAPTLENAEVFEDYDRAKEYMHELNDSMVKFFYDGAPWGVINFDFTDHFCEQRAEELVEDLKTLDPRVTGEEAAEAIKEASKNIRDAMTAKTTTRTSSVPLPLVEIVGEEITPEEREKGLELKQRVIVHNDLRHCAKCGQDLTEKICAHIGKLQTRCGTCERFDCVCLKCPLSGLPIIACGCDGCERLLADIDPDKYDKPTSLAEDAGEPEEDEDEATAIKPSHYARGAGGTTFDVIEALYQVLPWEQFKGYMKGNIIKYTVRYDDKNGTEDVEKAAEYNRRLMAYELREGAKNAD